MVNTGIDNSAYDKLPGLVLGFHGCDSDTYRRVLYKHIHLKKSENAYDWLGHGIYFWENSYERALEWANHKFGADGTVIGAVINLGQCLNLTDYRSNRFLEIGYHTLKQLHKQNGKPLPVNQNGRSDTDILLRNLDCAVIQQIHSLLQGGMMDLSPFDSVRGIFTEGEPAFPGSAIPQKTHVQICVVNPNCIKGYFAPLKPEQGYPMP